MRVEKVYNRDLKLPISLSVGADFSFIGREIILSEVFEQIDGLFLLLLEGDPFFRLKKRASQSEKRPEREEKPLRGLYCISCGNLITFSSERIEINGRHIHRFTNPHRITYEIGCFRTAPGCISEGPFETVWTWFPGYSWQIQLCSQCHRHIGWKYRRGGSFFFGLVLDYLTERTGE